MVSNRWSSYVVVTPQEFSGTFADDDARRHGVAGSHTRHDRAIGDSEILDSINLKFGVHNGHGISPHFCGTRLVVESGSRITDEVFQPDSF